MSPGCIYQDQMCDGLKGLSRGRIDLSYSGILMEIACGTGSGSGAGCKRNFGLSKSCDYHANAMK